MTTSSQPGWGPYLGGIVGYLAWVFALAVVCLIGGRAEWLLELCLPAFLLSLSLALATTVTLELVRQRFPEEPFRLQLALWGRLLCDIGILLGINVVWILPALREDDEIIDFLGLSLQATTAVPVWIPLFCLLLGASITVAVAKQILSAPAP